MPKYVEYNTYRFKVYQRVVVLSSWDNSVRHGYILNWPKVLHGPWPVKVDTNKRTQWIADDFLVAETAENKAWVQRPIDTDYPSLD
jgi:hypothetical protein